MKISNRLEAYLSWISTGIKPEDFDDEPRNMTEYWLQGEADRLDRMSGNKSSVAIRNLKKGAGDEKYDYADLENKPIQPYVEGDELVENKYYFTLKTDEEPTNIFQYVDGEQKSIIVEGEGRNAVLYDHQVKIVKDSNCQVFVQILNNSETALDWNGIYQSILQIGTYPASGWANGKIINYIFDLNGYLAAYYYNTDSSQFVAEALYETDVTVTDTVIKL